MANGAKPKRNNKPPSERTFERLRKNLPYERKNAPPKRKNLPYERKAAPPERKNLPYYEAGKRPKRSTIYTGPKGTQLPTRERPWTTGRPPAGGGLITPKLKQQVVRAARSRMR